MATHPRILAWELPWREEPGGLSPRGHKDNCVTKQQHLHNMDEGRVTYWMVTTVLLILQNKQWNNLPFKVICLGKVNIPMP